MVRFGALFVHPRERGIIRYKKIGTDVHIVGKWDGKSLILDNRLEEYAVLH